MNKRSAKKYIQYRIADAIDLVSISALQGEDEKIVRQKIDKLIGIYDSLVPEVNKVRTLDKVISRKKYFNDIFARLKKDINSIIGSKN